jgi:iron(III) transport system permease protein
VAASLVPVIYLFIRAWQGGWATIAATVWSEPTARLLSRSLGLAAAVTAASAVVGVALAWLTVRCDLPARRLWQVVAALPLAIPSYVAAFAYLGTFPDFEGFRAAFLLLTLLSYPYVYLPVAATLARMDPSMEEAARSLGDGPGRVFWRVTLRQLRPAAATGSLLVALYVLSDFGAVSILRFDTLTRNIYLAYQASFDRTPAVVLGCLLLVFTFAIVTAEARTRGRARYHSARGVQRPPTVVRLGRARWAALAAPVAVAVLALGLPIVALCRWLLEAAQLDLDLGRVRHAAWGSLLSSSLGAAVTVVAAVPAALIAARYRGRVAGAVERATYLAHALPGIVIALSLVFFSVRLGPLYQRLPVLVFAYFVLFLPLAVSAVYSSAVQAPQSLDEVARSLGRRPVAVLRTITAPLLAPGVAAGAALVFLTCMKELPATLLLGPTGFDTLATLMWSSTSVAAFGAAAVPAFLLVVLAAVPTWLLSRRVGVGPAGAAVPRPGTAVPPGPRIGRDVMSGPLRRDVR